MKGKTKKPGLIRKLKTKTVSALRSVVHPFGQLKLKNFLLLTVAGVVNSVGVTMFLAPVHLYDSGISGTSMLLGQVTPEWMTLSLFLLILNLPLFLYGLKKQGFAFTVYAIYAVAVYSLFAWLITDVLPVSVSTASPLAGQDLLLCALFGGVISGLGSGLAIRFGGAMDGIEVMAVIFAGKIGISIGSFVLVYNLILYIVCGVVMQSWILPLYSIVAYAVGTKSVDFVVDGFDRSKSAMIVTTEPEAISEALLQAFGCGVTRIRAMGGYSKTEKTVIYFVVNRFQIPRMREIIKEIDPKAYVTVTEISDIFSGNLNNL